MTSRTDYFFLRGHRLYRNYIENSSFERISFLFSITDPMLGWIAFYMFQQTLDGKVDLAFLDADQTGASGYVKYTGVHDVPDTLHLTEKRGVAGFAEPKGSPTRLSAYKFKDIIFVKLDIDLNIGLVRPHFRMNGFPVLDFQPLSVIPGRVWMLKTSAFDLEDKWVFPPELDSLENVTPWPQKQAI